jgi:hypothetical protein
MKLTAITDDNEISLTLSEAEAFVVHWALANYVGLIEYSLAHGVAAHPWPDDEPVMGLTPRTTARMVAHHSIGQDITSLLERMVY